MQVADTHNFAVNGGLIVHNCDALRYFAIQFTRPNEVQIKVEQKEWTQDQWEDYLRGTAEEREMMISMWGAPKVSYVFPVNQRL